MLSKNYFLDIMADVKSDYVEEVLFMPQFAQDNKELEKYRKKSNFGKIFGSIAACVALIGVGITALMLHNSGFLTTPGESTITEDTGAATAENGTSTEVTGEATTENSTDSSQESDSIADYDYLTKPLYAAINRSDTFEAMFEEFDKIDTEKKIAKVLVYKSRELLDQNAPMEEEELTGSIPEGAIIHVYFNETDLIQFGKTYKNPDDYMELVIALTAALDKSDTFEEMFEAFDEIDKKGMISKIVIYKSSELRDQGIAMKEEELKGVIAEGTDIFVYFGESETDYVEMGKTIKNRALPEGVILQGLAGDDILPEDIKEVSYDNPENPAAWSSVDCEGFCYLSEPGGYCFNNLENPEMFDPDTGSYIDNITNAQPKKRYNVGDEICGLKVKSAGFSLMNMYGDNDHPDSCRAFNSVSFEGSVELTGYLWIDDEKNAYFVPNHENGKKLPVLGTPFGQRNTTGYVGDKFVYSWENPVIECETVTGLNADNMEKNKPVKLDVTLTDFGLGFAQGGPVDSFAHGTITLKALP